MSSFIDCKVYSIQFNSIQFNSIQFNSIQFNSIQFYSIQFICRLPKEIKYKNNASAGHTCIKDANT